MAAFFVDLTCPHQQQARRAVVRVHQLTAPSAVSLHPGESPPHRRRLHQVCAKEQACRGLSSGSCVSPRLGAVAIAWQQPLVLGPLMERPNCCGFVKLQHTSREWLKQNAWCPPCRSRHGPIQEYRPVLQPRTVVTRPRRWATCSPDGARSNRLKSSRSQRRHASGLAAPLLLFPRNRPVAQVRLSGLSVSRRQHSPHRCR